MQTLVTVITFCLIWNARCLPPCELCKLVPIGPDMGACDVNTYICPNAACSTSTACPITSPVCCCSPGCGEAPQQGCGAVYFPEVVYPTPFNTANTISCRSCWCG